MLPAGNQLSPNAAGTSFAGRLGPMTGPELLVVLCAVVVGAVLKSVTGMGLPIIGIPIISLVVGVEDAVVVIALPNLVLNAALMFRERSHLTETRDLPMLAGAGILGAVIGAFVLLRAPEEPIIAALVAVVAIYVVLFFAAPSLTIDPTTSRRWAPAAGATAGFLQGSIGISGPVVATWIHAYRLPRGAHIASVTSLFLITGVTQFVILLGSGEMSGRWVAALISVIHALATVPFGASLRDRLSSRGFDLAIVATLSVSVGVLAIRTFA